jgi:hypothetical protein
LEIFAIIFELKTDLFSFFFATHFLINNFLFDKNKRNIVCNNHFNFQNNIEINPFFRIKNIEKNKNNSKKNDQNFYQLFGFHKKFMLTLKNENFYCRYIELLLHVFAPFFSTIVVDHHDDENIVNVNNNNNDKYIINNKNNDDSNELELLNFFLIEIFNGYDEQQKNNFDIEDDFFIDDFFEFDFLLHVLKKTKKSQQHLKTSTIFSIVIENLKKKFEKLYPQETQNNVFLSTKFQIFFPKILEFLLKQENENEKKFQKNFFLNIDFQEKQFLNDCLIMEKKIFELNLES